MKEQIKIEFEEKDEGEKKLLMYIDDQYKMVKNELSKESRQR